MIALALTSIAFGLLGIIYPIIKRKAIIARGQKPLSAILGGVFFLIVGVSVLFLYEDKNDHKEKVVTKTDTSKVLTLPDFIKSYTENAKAINARYDFDWTVSTGEKLDSIKIHVNEYCAMSLSVNKTNNKEIKGMTIAIGDTDEKSAVEILAILYALVQTFNPEGDYGSVPAFVSDFVNQESEYKIKKGKVEYSLTKFSGNTVIFIICE